MAGRSSASNPLRKYALLLILYIVLYVFVSAYANNFVIGFLASMGIILPSGYLPYINILLALAFGYLIVNEFASVVYFSVRRRLPHSTASAVKNMLRIIGLGGLAAAIAGSVAGGAAGVALGGFLGLVVGTATQNVLGQAVAGLFLQLSRPFKVGERAMISGEEGVVDEVTTLFTVIFKDDGTKVLIPNGSVVGNKISIRPEGKPTPAPAT